MVDCTKEALDKFGDYFSDNEINQFVKDLNEMKMSDRGKYATRSKKYRDALKNNLEYISYKQAEMVVKRQEITSRFDKLVGTKASYKQIIESFAGGSEHIIEGGNIAFDGIKKEFQERMITRFDSALGDDIHLAKTGTKDIEIAKVIEKLNNDPKAKDFGKGISPEAQRIGRAIHGFNDYFVKSLQDIGVFIKERPDFIWRQSHNLTKITSVGDSLDASKEIWINDIRNSLDDDKTFAPIIKEDAKGNIIETAYTEEMKKARLEAIFDSIAEGDFENHMGNFGGRRSLHFKDAESFAIYNQKYGHGTAIDTIAQTIMSGSKHFASTKIWGPDAKKGIAHLRKLMSNQAKRKGDLDVANALMKGDEAHPGIGTVARRFNNLEKEMFGHDNHLGKDIIGKTQRTLTGIQAMSKLKYTPITAITDIGFAVTHQMASGSNRNFLSSNVNTVISSLNMLRPSQRKQWARAIGHQLNDNIMDTMGKYEGTPQALIARGAEKAMRKITNATGIEWQASSNRLNASRFQAVTLADNALKTLDDIKKVNPRLAGYMKRFAIDETDWGILKQSVSEIEGMRFIDPDHLENLDISVFESAAKAKKMGVRRYRQDLVTRYSSALHHSAMQSSPLPGILERAAVNQGFAPNTAEGAIMRTMFQFQTFTLALPRILRTAVKSNPNIESARLMDHLFNSSNMATLGVAAGELMGLTALSMSLKDYIRNKPQKDYSSPDVLLEVFNRAVMPLAAGHTLSILRGDYGKFGRSIFKDALGPTAGSVEDGIRLYSSLVQGKKSTSRDAVKFMWSHAPGVGMWYVDWVTNRAIYDGLMEWADPAYARRMKALQLK